MVVTAPRISAANVMFPATCEMFKPLTDNFATTVDVLLCDDVYVAVLL